MVNFRIPIHTEISFTYVLTVRSYTLTCLEIKITNKLRKWNCGKTQCVQKCLETII